jgi:hypothetical protein
VTAKAVAAAVAARRGHVHIDHQAIGIKNGTSIPLFLYSSFPFFWVDSRLLFFVPFFIKRQALAGSVPVLTDEGDVIG